MQFLPSRAPLLAAAHAAPGDQAALGDAAHDRDLYRDAAQLHKHAAASGNTDTFGYLSHPPDCLHADPRPVHWAAAHVPLDNPWAVAELLDRLRAAGAHEQATALLACDPAAHAPLDDPVGAASLLDSLREAGAHEQAAALLARDPAAHALLDDPLGVAGLLGSLREAGAHEQAAALTGRAAAHTPLDNPDDVASLLHSLREAGAHEQAAALAARAAAHTPLDDPSGVDDLLDSLREAGAHEQAAALTDRLPAAGMFGLFLEQEGLADQFRFGREADGAPAAPWGWEDLDLWLVLPAAARRRRRSTERVYPRGIGPPGHRHRNRRDDLNNRFPNR
jgi:hypothetical protein